MPLGAWCARHTDVGDLQPVQLPAAGQLFPPLGTLAVAYACVDVEAACYPTVTPPAADHAWGCTHGTEGGMPCASPCAMQLLMYVMEAREDVEAAQGPERLRQLLADNRELEERCTKVGATGRAAGVAADGAAAGDAGAAPATGCQWPPAEACCVLRVVC